MEAIQYIRFSTAEQAAGGSLERQRLNVAEHISRNSWTIGEEFFDRGKSAFKNAHRQGSAALARLEAEAGEGLHAGKVLVVEKLDRLSRLDPLATIDLVRHFLRHGVSISTVFTGAFFEAGKPLPTEQIYPLVAETDANFMFSKTLQARVTSGWQLSRKRALDEGKALTKKVPGWLRVLGDRRMEVVPSRAALVRRWFDMAEEGMGARAIVRQMEKEGVGTWGSSKVWNRSYISKVLANRAVLGEFQPTTLDGDKRVPLEPWPNYYPTIGVSPDQFARVNNTAEARKSMGVARAESTVPNLFAGLIRCRCCNGFVNYHLVRKAGFLKPDNRPGRTSFELRRDEGKLQCRIARISGGARCENRKAWAYLTFEDAVISALLPLAMDEGSFANRGEVARVAALIAEREREIEIETMKGRRLWSAWAEGGSDSLTALARASDEAVRALGRDLALLKDQHQQATGRVSTAAHLARLEHVAANLHGGNIDLRTSLRRRVSISLRQLVDGITLDNDRATIRLKAGAGLLFVDRRGAVWGFDLHKEGPADLDDYSRRHRRAKLEGRLPFRKVA